MASIEKRTRGDGTDSYRVVWRDPDIQAKRSLTFNERRKAERAKALLDSHGQRLDAASGTAAAIERDERSVAELVTEHVDSLTGITARTREDYRRIARRHITPPLGALPAAQLTRRQVSGWVRDLETKSLSAKTIANTHALLSASYQTAMEDREVAGNPCRGVRLPRSDSHDNDMCLLTPDELRVILSELPSHYRLVVRFLYDTGVRWGEAVALTVGDLNPDAVPATVRVNKAIGRSSSGTFFVTRTKTTRGRRTVSLPPALATALTEATEGQAHDAPLLCGPSGGWLWHSHFYERTWKPAVERAQDTERHPTDALTKRPRIHDLRHSHGSWLIANGVDLLIVQRRMGHESVTMTADRYGHPLPDHLQRAAEVADKADAGLGDI